MVQREGDGDPTPLSVLCSAPTAAICAVPVGATSMFQCYLLEGRVPLRRQLPASSTSFRGPFTLIRRILELGKCSHFRRHRAFRTKTPRLKMVRRLATGSTGRARCNARAVAMQARLDRECAGAIRSKSLNEGSHSVVRFCGIGASVASLEGRWPDAATFIWVKVPGRV